jgi:hypothetical protein
VRKREEHHESDAGYRLDLQASWTTICFGLHVCLPMRTQPRHVFDTITSRAQAYPSNASERAARAAKPNIIHHNQAPHLLSPPRALETPTAGWIKTAMLEEQAPSSTTSIQQISALELQGRMCNGLPVFSSTVCELRWSMEERLERSTYVVCRESLARHSSDDVFKRHIHKMDVLLESRIYERLFFSKTIVAMTEKESILEKRSSRE